MNAAIRSYDIEMLHYTGILRLDGGAQSNVYYSMCSMSYNMRHNNIGKENVLNIIRHTYVRIFNYIT